MIKPLTQEMSIPLIAVTFDNIISANEFSKNVAKIKQENDPLNINENEKTYTVYISDVTYNTILNDDDAYAKIVSNVQTSALQS